MSSVSARSLTSEQASTMLDTQLAMAKAIGNDSGIAFRTSAVVDAADFEAEMDLVGMLEQDQGYINNRAAIIALMKSLTVHTQAEIEAVLATAAGRQKLFDGLALRVASWCADNKAEAKAILEAMAGITEAAPVVPVVRSRSPRSRSPSTRSPRSRSPRSPSSGRDVNDFGSFSSDGEGGSGYLYNGNSYRYSDQAGMRGL